MSRWGALPGDGPDVEWRGPTENQGGTMREYRGLVVHIAQGTYEGTIAWQRNPASNVSSHFIIGRDGRIAQMVDTNRIAWTQRAGNGHWLSAECAGWVEDGLSGAQVHALARLFVRGHVMYGWPLSIASKPEHRGLGHHSMGGASWGHLACPGKLIISQKPDILAGARALLAPPKPEAARWPLFLFSDLDGGDLMHPYALIKHKDATKKEVFACYSSGAVRHIGPAEHALLSAADAPGGPLALTITADLAEYQRLKKAAALLGA